MSPRQLAALHRTALGLVFALPVFLLHGRGIADAAIVLVALLFLVHTAATRSWGWLRTPWLIVALAWWGWQLLCSIPAGREATLQAALLLRFFVFAAALQAWVLSTAAARRWLARIVRWSAFYIAAQCLLQLVTGRDLFGYGRGPDRELTGPYEHPRAGPPLVRLLYPALVPLAGNGGALAGAAWLLGGAVTMFLIGQRMPFLLALLGLFTTALLLPRLRGAVFLAVVLTGALLAASPFVAPAAYYRLVTKFSAQMAGFADSAYGEIAARAWAIARAHPFTGAGYDGFRRLCADPAYFHGWPWEGDGDGGGAAMCVQHPHNHYLEALVNGGWPGLLLFAAAIGAILLTLGRGLWRTPDPLRVGLFTAALIHEFPLASANAFASMPVSGWFFLLLGLGLAEGTAYMEATSPPGRPSWPTPPNRPFPPLAIPLATSRPSPS